jgi:hypothetical protein
MFESDAELIYMPFSLNVLNKYFSTPTGKIYAFLVVKFSRIAKGFMIAHVLCGCRTNAASVLISQEISLFVPLTYISKTKLNTIFTTQKMDALLFFFDGFSDSAAFPQIN